jgi:hypothetical protein
VKAIHSHLKKLVAVTMLLLISLPVLAREVTEVRVDLRVNLTGIVLNGVQTKGKVEFENEAGIQRLLLEVNNISVPDATSLAVFISGVRAGTINVRHQGGTLLLSTNAGQTLPAIGIGTSFTVNQGTTTILSGTF